MTGPTGFTNILAGYVPQLATTVKPPKTIQYLALLSNQLDLDVIDLTSGGQFGSIRNVFTQYNNLYIQTAMAVAISMDLAQQMLGVAEYLYVNPERPTNTIPVPYRRRGLRQTNARAAAAGNSGSQSAGASGERGRPVM